MSRSAEAQVINLMGVDFDALTEQETCARICSEMNGGRGGMIVTVNLDHLRRCQQSVGYRELVKKAELVVADGMPLVWASWLQATPLPERVAGSSLCSSLTRALAANGRSLFLLGANPGVAEQAAKKMKLDFPAIKIAGCCCPERGFERDSDALARICQRLMDAQPDMVYVALGSPKQEELIDRLRPFLPDAWWMGVGISLSFLVGEVRRAPLWLQRLGLEWLHRLLQEPKRLGRRYLIEGLPFAFRLFSHAVWNRGIDHHPRRVQIQRRRESGPKE